MAYETLTGESCFTASEAAKLIGLINKKSPAKVSQLRGQWLYYVHLENGLDKVKQLLHVTGQPRSSASDGKSVDIYITPLNISPWSSKATSIAHVCGLKDQVHRMERGRVVTIEFEDSYDGEQELAALRDVIHDRMTENFALEPPALHDMFGEKERLPLIIVDIFADGKDPLSELQKYNKAEGLGLDQPVLPCLCLPLNLRYITITNSAMLIEHGVPRGRVQKPWTVANRR